MHHTPFNLMRLDPAPLCHHGVAARQIVSRGRRPGLMKAIRMEHRGKPNRIAMPSRGLRSTRLSVGEGVPA